MTQEIIKSSEFVRRYGNKHTRGKKRGEMNKLESNYAQALEFEKKTGFILDYKYEEFKLRLADGAWYTPDFAVYMPDGSLEFRETKGHWREAARVRIKVAAEQFPKHRFIAVQKCKEKYGGGWMMETFSPRSV